MTRISLGLFFMAAALALCGCKTPVSYGVAIDGPYRLYPAGPAGGYYLCYEVRPGFCPLRGAAPVIAYGVSEDFISVAVAASEEEKKHRDKWDFYYVIRFNDGPGADPAYSVRGPFNERQFIDQMETHGVPTPDQIVAN